MVSPPRFHCNNKIFNGQFFITSLACLYASASATFSSASSIPQTQLLAANNAEFFLRAARREQDLYLAVSHGETPTGLIVHARLVDNRLYVTAAELLAIGLQVSPQDEQSWVALDTLPGLSYRYDIPTQALVLYAPPNLRQQQHLGYQLPPPVEVHRDHGLLFSYDFYAREWQHSNSASLGTSVNWFGNYGSLEISGVSRHGDENIGYRRLDSRWTYSDPQRLWTWTAGDLISGGHYWNRPVRMAGLQWRRNFDVRPDLITIPVPRFAGSAALPSSVELYVNNILQYGDAIQT
jgi:outer membrane usher protein